MNRLAYLALAALLSTFACVGCAAGDATGTGEEDVQQSAASSSELGDKVIVGMPKADVREGLDGLGARKIDAVTNENMQTDPTLKLDSDRARFNDNAAIANEAKPDLGLVTEEELPRTVFFKKY
jgi:hypothetical protein